MLETALADAFGGEYPLWMVGADRSESRAGTALVLVLALGFAVAASWSPTADAAPNRLEPTEPIALVGVSVLPINGTPAGREGTIVIRNGRIASIDMSGRAEPGPEVRTIDAAGRFVMPGLIDTHVHLRHADASALRRYLQAGVTTVREMNGRPSLLRWRDRIRAGELIGPTLVVAAPTAGNFSSPREGYPTPESVEDGQAWVRRFREEGYDWIKVYSFLPAEGFDGIMSEARRLEMPVGGHVPISVGLDAALASGMRSIEHLTEYVGSTLTPESSRLDEVDNRSVFHAGVVDPERLDALVARIASRKVWNVPTIVWFDRNLPTSRLADVWSEPALREQGKRNRRDIVARLHAAGARIALGTDSDDGHDLSADAIHDELEALAGTGVPIEAVLEAATLAGARLLGIEAEVGSIEVGKRADLLVLYCDPRLDLACVREPEFVVSRGRILP